MFERFTEGARRMVVLAQEEARRLGHGYIGTEHLLLGLLRKEGYPAARVLQSLDITAERARVQVVDIVGSSERATSGQIPFTPQAKKVFELARGKARSLGQNYIGTAHILLALGREREDVASGRAAEDVGARILLDFGADPERVREAVMRLLGWSARCQGAGAAAQQSETTSGERHLDALLDEARPLLAPLVGEIEGRLERPADAGDLLVVLACVPAGLAARTLALLGIDAGALARAAEEARRDEKRTELLPPEELASEIEDVRDQKWALIKAQEFDGAAKVRARERELSQQAHQGVEQRLSEVLDEVRGRLGLADG